MEVKKIMKKIKQHDVQYLQEFFRKYPHKINQTSSTGGTYLMAACVEGHTDLISFLIETGAELDLRDKYGRTALYYAVNNRRRDAVALLLCQGANVNIKDTEGKMPLHVAVQNNDKVVIEVLLSNKGNNSLQVNQEDNNGWTPLHVVCDRGHTDIVKLLLPLPGININAVDKEYGVTPLHLACARGHTDIVKLLLPLPGINTNVVNKRSGYTPLHCAVQGEQYDMVAMMLSQDSVELYLKDCWERTPLLQAISKGHFGIIHLLISHGAEINAVDDDDNNCLHLAVNNYEFHSEVEPISILNEYCTKLNLSMRLRLTQPVVVSYLAHHGADLYCKNKNNVTALDLIQNADLREKIKSLFPPLQCMFCKVNKPLMKFHPCGHSLPCKECYLQNAPKKCPKCQQIDLNKSGFETPKIEKNVPKVSQPTPSTSSISQPIESPKSYEQFLKDVAQQFTDKWQIESPKSYEQFLHDLAQQLTCKWQKIETPKIEKNVLKVSQPTLNTSSILQPIETPNIEKKVPKVLQPTPGTSSTSQPVVSPELEQKHLHNVAKKLGNKWQQVGRELGIQQDDLDIINYNYPNDAVEQSFQMLYRWFRRCDPEKLSIEKLREALKEIDCFTALKCLSLDVK